jgi:predicted flap endonuclease-1-like 5' DNA nuclease
MIHYLIELAIWMLIAYFIGCLVGWVLRNLFAKPAAVQPVESAPAVKAAPVYTPPPAPKPVVAPTPVAAAPKPPVAAQPVAAARQPVMAPTPVAAKPAVSTTPAPRPAPVPVAAPAAPVEDKMERPRGLSGPRNGKADNLQRISGIGPKNEGILHGLGFFHFDQIAAWTAQHVSWVDDHLRFNGRINREEWIKQAKLLAEGKDAEFAKQYGTGGLRNTRGQTLSGSRTRK